MSATGTGGGLFRASPASGVAWVTGASSGIGKAVALDLLRRGYRVALTARRGELLEQIAAQNPQRAFAFAGDVTDRAAMADLVARIEAELGPIALAFLNVGHFIADAPGIVGGDGFRQTMDVNLTGTVNCLEPLVARMRQQGRGQIAINASVAGYGGLPIAAPYNASKAALIVLSESLKMELERANIRLQVVNPGFVKTPLVSSNRFPMPYALEPEAASQRICDGIERGGFEITFPRRLSYALKLLNMLPYGLYFAVMRRVSGRIQ